MKADSLARRTVAATLLTAALSSLVLAAASALVLRLLWRRHDQLELSRTADAAERTLRLELEEHQHDRQAAAGEVLDGELGPTDRGVIRSGALVLASRGEGPVLDLGAPLPPGWVGTRRPMAEGLVIEIARRPEDGLPLRRLFWAALLVAALPSAAVALVVGRWAGRAAARPIEDLARRLGPLHHPRDYVPAPLESLPAEAAVLERAFALVLGRLGDALEREADFARNASHELRTPLTRIRLRAERAAAGAAGECRHELLVLVAEVDRLARLSDALLVLAREPAGGLGAGETVNLADVVRASAGGGERPVTVTAPDEVLVRGDEDLLRLAVDNLLDNARKYAPEGLTPAATLKLEADGAALAVETPGVTLEEGEREAVFERFYRGAAAREKASGHGLGLALARHVARFHGGDVVVGEGGDSRTVFELRLPGWRSES